MIIFNFSPYVYPHYKILYTHKVSVPLDSALAPPQGQRVIELNFNET